MKDFNLTAKLREKSTKGALNKNRKIGFVPCVLYGVEGNTNLFCFVNDLNDLIYTNDLYVVNLKFDSKKYRTVIKEIQYHPLSDAPIHVDFMEITDDKTIKIEFPINFVGTPIGARQGGKVFKKLRKLHLKGKISELPDQIDIDISELDLGDMIKVKDLDLPDIEIMDQSTTPLVSVAIPRVIEEVVVEEEEEEEEITDEDQAPSEEKGKTTEGPKEPGTEEDKPK